MNSSCQPTIPETSFVPRNTNKMSSLFLRNRFIGIRMKDRKNGIRPLWREWFFWIRDSSRVQDSLAKRRQIVNLACHFPRFDYERVSKPTYKRGWDKLEWIRLEIGRKRVKKIKLLYGGRPPSCKERERERVKINFNLGKGLNILLGQLGYLLWTEVPTCQIL